MGFKELPESRQAQAKGLSPVCEHYGQTRRIPDKLVTFPAKCRDADAAMTLTKTKTPQWCWYVDFMKTIASFITGVFTLRMVNCLIPIAPFGQPIVNVVFVGKDFATDGHELLDDGLAAVLLHIG